MAFPTTRWTELVAATLGGDEGGRSALARMCADYRRPVEAFLAFRGYRGDEIPDLTQEFFLHWLESRAWKRADRARGRFRTFLLAALKHMLAHQYERQSAAKRGGGEKPASLDELIEAGGEPPGDPAPTAPEFDREWAFVLVENVLGEIRRENADRGRLEEFEVLRHFLPGSEHSLTMEEAAQELGLNVNAVKAAIHRLRGRFREGIRAAVARTVSAPHEIDEELIYLRSLLSLGLQVSRNPEAGKRKVDGSE